MMFRPRGSGQFEDEKLLRFVGAYVVGVVKMAAAIEGVGCHRRPVRQWQCHVGAGQYHVIAAGRSAGPTEDQIGSRSVEGRKLRFPAPAPCHQGEIRAAVVGLPGYGRRESEAAEVARI